MVGLDQERAAIAPRRKATKHQLLCRTGPTAPSALGDTRHVAHCDNADNAIRVSINRQMADSVVPHHFQCVHDSIRILQRAACRVMMSATSVAAGSRPAAATRTGVPIRSSPSATGRRRCSARLSRAPHLRPRRSILREPVAGEALSLHMTQLRYCGRPSTIYTRDFAAFSLSGIRSLYGGVLYHFVASAMLSKARMTMVPRGGSPSLPSALPRTM